MPPVIAFQRPDVDLGQAARFLAERYGLTGTIEELPSERDRNFLVRPAGRSPVVLKVAHADEARDVLDLQHRALARLADRAPDLTLPMVVSSQAGDELVTLAGQRGDHLARVLTWVPGRVWAEVSPHSPPLLDSLGRVLGRIDRALEGFDHPAAHRELKWDLTRPQWARPLVRRIADPTRRALVERHLDRFDTLASALAALPRSVIHNDANDWNVVVGEGHPDQRTVIGVVDFGDMLESVTVAELAIGCAYAMQGAADPLSAAAAVVRGYHAARPLAEAELSVLLPLIATRLAVSVANAAHQRELFPDNAYLAVSERPAWETLDRLESVHPRFAEYTFRAAAGYEPVPAAAAVRGWLAEHGDRIGPVLDLPLDPPATTLDLSVASPLIEHPDEPLDAGRFGRKLFAEIRRRGAGLGIGRYDEPRLLYTTDRYQASGNDRPVPRTVHLGLDLFVAPGTGVLAPLDGVVESVRDNGMDLDYGPTIVLRHAVGGVVFHTLYGHLASDCLEALTPGRTVTRGDRIGAVGDRDVNGGWPPHLHLQLIVDRLDRDGEFPGVARADQREVWKSLSPDPNLVTRLRTETSFGTPPAGALLQARRTRLGPSLSVSYRRPLTIVRGWKQHLYDDLGLAYLDGVNNVPHVGHSHPRVVAAARAQMAVLNTNTRYLHPTILEYAERLTATLPEPLRVCYFVNSGSEANELAIRLARAATGRRGMVVIEAGYHGNTTTLIDVSPYKHDGPGGRGAPAWVRKIPMPDPYRGRDRRDQTGAAAVTDAIAALEAQGEAPAAFLAESILSCGGQIVLPKGFLAEAYRRIRQVGGVAIADEVQVGFGRVGTHWWAFETQGVIPDIVTMGKPIGNGHPLGAVVTTPAIAQAFTNGMEFFSTFGGNPVSCAVGLAVLNVVEDEGLRQAAHTVGDRLLRGLEGLVARHPLAGDARGLGLFVGLELVRSRTSLEPAREEASYLANRLRDLGILVSTDGPFGNVLKMKPPLCFTAADADRLVESLDRVLGEDYPARAARD